MAGMKQSLPGLFRNTELCLRSSKDDMARALGGVRCRHQLLNQRRMRTMEIPFRLQERPIAWLLAAGIAIGAGMSISHIALNAFKDAVFPYRPANYEALCKSMNDVDEMKKQRD